MAKNYQTLGEFIIQNQNDFKYSTGELSRLLSCIKLATKVVNQEVNKAGLVEKILGDVGSENVQGEQQKKLDVFANETFIKALTQREVVCGIASEENEDFIQIEGGGNSHLSKYVVLIDPLDGSSNADVNVTVGDDILGISSRNSRGNTCADGGFFTKRNPPSGGRLCAVWAFYDFGLYNGKWRERVYAGSCHWDILSVAPEYEISTNGEYLFHQRRKLCAFSARGEGLY